MRGWDSFSARLLAGYLYLHEWSLDECGVSSLSCVASFSTDLSRRIHRLVRYAYPTLSLLNSDSGSHADLSLGCLCVAWKVRLSHIYILSRCWPYSCSIHTLLSGTPGPGLKSVGTPGCIVDVRESILLILVYLLWRLPYSSSILPSHIIVRHIDQYFGIFSNHVRHDIV